MPVCPLSENRGPRGIH